MSDLSYTKLSDLEIAARLQALPDWQVEDGALTRLFSFEAYADGVMFAAACGRIADVLNHHPDIMIGYQKVRVSMVTHDAGGGLTAYDFELAKRINLIT